MGLKRFDNNLPTKKKSIKQIIMILCICLIAVISVTSYAIFQVRHSKPIADAKVGKFKTSDIILEILIDGEKSETFPEKESNKVFKELTCTNGGIAEWDNETWELSILDISGPTECIVSFEKEKTGADKLIELAKTNTTEMFTDDTTDKNIRYMGADPNNYVDIGNGDYLEDVYRGYNSTYKLDYREYASLLLCQRGIDKEYKTNCTKVHSVGDPILWRIIGVMNNVDDGTGKKETRIKIIREHSIGPLAWHSLKNNWSLSSINTILNNDYFNRQNNYAGSGLEMIDDSLVQDAVFHLGSPTKDNYNTLGVLSFYNVERGSSVYKGNPTTWTGKVGLMYPSDYIFATSGGNNKSKYSCTNNSTANWYENDYEDCKTNDWLFESSMNQWTITPCKSYSSSATYLSTFGYIATRNNSVPDVIAVRPVVYLRSDVKITGGDGTKENPYKIGL